MQKGTLAYNDSNKRYGIIDSMDLWINDGLHCGTLLQVLIDDEYVPMHIEMTLDEKWYLTDYKDLNIYDLDYLKVKRD